MSNIKLLRMFFVSPICCPLCYLTRGSSNIIEGYTSIVRRFSFGRAPTNRRKSLKHGFPQGQQSIKGSSVPRAPAVKRNLCGWEHSRGSSYTDVETSCPFKPNLCWLQLAPTRPELMMALRVFSLIQPLQRLPLIASWDGPYGVGFTGIRGTSQFM